MPRLFNLFALLTVFVSCVSAMWPNEWIVGNTCQQASKVNFDECNSQAGDCLCNNQNYLATVAQCIRSSLNSTLSIDDGWDFVVVTTCRKTPAQSDQLYKQVSEYLNRTSLTFLEADFNKSEVFTVPVVIDRQSLKAVFRSVSINLENKDISVWQGSALVMFFIVIIMMTALSNFLRFIAYKFTSRKQAMSRPSAPMRFLQKHVLIPACFGTKHIDRVYFLEFIPLFIPTRMESIIIGIYGILSFCFLCGNYNTMHNNPLWATPYSVTVLNLSNRAGIIATIQIPLLTLFALRNNLLIWVTGWSFSTFNAYHRAIARITFLMLIVHAVGKILMMMTFHVPLAKILYPEMMYRLGVAGLGLMALMIIFSFLRTKIYELFLAVHIVGAFGTYLVALYHLNGLGYKEAIYVSLAIWAVDWLIRLVRIIFINLAVFLDPVGGAGRITKANVTILEGDVINVKIKTPIKWTVTPGQYVFIHFPKINIMQSHPFSVVGPSDDGESFQLMCKARGGITKKLQNYVSSEGANSKYPTQMTVLIEGPYGSHCPVERYETVLLVAGGIGITGIIPYVEFLAYQAPRQQHVVFVWTVGLVEEFSWIKDRLQKLVRSGKVELRLYVTQSGKEAKITAPYSVVYEHKETQTDYGADLYKPYTNAPGIKQPVQVRVTNVSEERDSFELGDGLASDSAYATKPVERKRASLYKHIKSLSQGSARFQLDPTQRSENVDGSDMVAWPGPQRPHHEIRRNRSIRGEPRSQFLNQSQDVKVDLKPALYFKGQRNSVAPQQQPYGWTDYIQQGRPNLPDQVSELFLRASGSVAVVGCGPAKMMDTLRQAVVLNLDMATQGRVEYFEEAFTW